MGTEILKSFGSLQHELEEAKNNLKSVDENIKKLIGRDPSELPSRLNKKRLPQIDDKGRAGLKNINRIRNNIYDSDAPPIKRRNNESVFKRLSAAPVPDDTHQEFQKQMISKVIVTSKEIPSRQEAMDAQNKDEKFKARNRRMFGALLGTLQKFQQEETKLKPREEKRAQLEKKIEEHEIKEKEEIKKERHELFVNRKKKQIEIKIIELKMTKMREYAAWEETQKPRGNFVLTKAEPHIHYLPRRLNNKTKELLSSSKQEIQALIESRSQQVLEEIKHIEEKMKRNFNNKYGLKTASNPEEPGSGEDQNHNDHFENAMTELNESENGKCVEVNADSEAPTELSTVDKDTENTSQDKENKEIVNEEENSEVVVTEKDMDTSQPDASIREEVI